MTRNVNIDLSFMLTFLTIMIYYYQRASIFWTIGGGIAPFIWMLLQIHDNGTGRSSNETL